MPTVGEMAPDFEVKDQTGQLLKLSSKRGKKVLLAFFPYAFSGTCTEELSCFRDDLSQFQGRNVEVMGISVDSHHAQRAFAASLQATYPLLSDFSRNVSREYGVLRPDGASERAYFVIDEKGKIIFAKVMEALGKRLDNAELLAFLQ